MKKIPGQPAFRLYSAHVTAITRLSPHLVRLTFTGPLLDRFGDDGLDQRIKVFFAREGEQLNELGADQEATSTLGWYAEWREMSEEERTPFRTYTVRRVRQHLAEVDIDFVDHGPLGPAGEWLGRAEIGSEVLIAGPDGASPDSAVGIDWHPGAAEELLLAGDETALPAICSILESLDESRRATAYIEIPEAADALPITTHDGVTIEWLPRDGTEHGALLRAALTDWADANGKRLAGRVHEEVTDVDVDTTILWDVPTEEASAGFYAWFAGEAGTVKLLRRLLVSEHDIPRSRVAFMGYWRIGRSEVA